ncbi:MAG: hypothetical protein K8L99_33830 [Anaerolineae bacterium]|nr:hypothetical protein [Anaerolineae bacterium]
MDERKYQKTITNIPGWLLAGVADYQQKNGIQSWSQAATILMAIGLYRSGNDHIDDTQPSLGGSLDAEAEMWDLYNDSDFEGQFEDWIVDLIGQSWGGKRPDAGRKVSSD